MGPITIGSRVRVSCAFVPHSFGAISVRLKHGTTKLRYSHYQITLSARGTSITNFGKIQFFLIPKRTMEQNTLSKSNPSNKFSILQI